MTVAKKQYRGIAPTASRIKKLIIIVGILILLFVGFYNWRIQFSSELFRSAGPPVLESSRSSEGSDFIKRKPADSCRLLLADGRFGQGTINGAPCWYNETLAGKQKKSSHECNQRWEPFGCKMNYYSDQDLLQCLNRMSTSQQKTILLCGDSRMRSIFVQLIKLFEIKHFREDQVKHKSNAYFHNETNTTLRFYTKEFAEYIPGVIQEIKKLIKTGPLMMLYGIALHDIKAAIEAKKQDRNDPGRIKHYELYLWRAREDFDKIAKEVDFIWMVQPPYVVQRQAQIECKEHGILRIGWFYSQAEMDKRNKFINAYNDAAIKILNGTSVRLWFGARRIGELSQFDYCDNVHLRDYVNANYAQIILNYFCNKYMEKMSDNDYCCLRR